MEGVGKVHAVQKCPAGQEGGVNSHAACSHSATTSWRGFLVSMITQYHTYIIIGDVCWEDGGVKGIGGRTPTLDSTGGSLLLFPLAPAFEVTTSTGFS